MNKAEEILDKYYQPKMHWKSVNRKQVISAMKEYASTVNENKGAVSDAIEFLDWSSENNYRQCYTKNENYKKWYSSTVPSDKGFFTTEELYREFRKTTP